MAAAPAPEDDGAWYEEELDKLFRLGTHDSFGLTPQWRAWDVFPTVGHAHVAAKRGDRVAQQLLKETYERYIIAKLTG